MLITYLIVGIRLLLAQFFIDPTKQNFIITPQCDCNTCDPDQKSSAFTQDFTTLNTLDT